MEAQCLSEQSAAFNKFVVSTLETGFAKDFCLNSSQEIWAHTQVFSETHLYIMGTFNIEYHFKEGFSRTFHSDKEKMGCRWLTLSYLQRTSE